MSKESYHHGARTFESGETQIPFRLPQTSVTAIVGTAPDADATLFPYNKPIAIISEHDLRNKLTKLGTAGTLRDDVLAVTKSVLPYLYVVRVEEGADYNATIANLVGDPLTMTGVHALKKCQSLYGDNLKPRIVSASGYTATLASDGITSVNVTDGGLGYVKPKVVTQGDGHSVELGVTHEDGIIQEIYVIKPGYNCDAVNTTILITDEEGTGSGATAELTVGTAANPVAAELAALMPQLNAFAYIDGPDTTDADAVLSAAKYNSAYMQMVDPKVIEYDRELEAYVPKPGSAYFAGMRALVDAEMGFHHSVSNKVIQGIEGTNRPIPYTRNPDIHNVANYLNENRVATIVSRDAGYRTWGDRTLSTDPLKAFENVHRTTMFLNEAIEDAMVEFTDKLLNKAQIKYAVESGREFLKTMHAKGIIANGDFWIEYGENNAQTAAQGQVTFSADYEPYPPMEDIRINIFRNIIYLEEDIKDIASQFGRRSYGIAA